MNTRRRSFSATAFLGAAAALSFVLAMHTFPGGYNPLMRMLSALGRTEVRLVEWPWSHYLFVAGMFFSVLAAAARACSDAETAERLERAVDAKYLRREGGLLWLDVNREWRIGATAMRIISLAESNGSRFRDMNKMA